MKFKILFFVLFIFVSNTLPAREITPESVGSFRRNLERRYHRADFPYVNLPLVIEHVSYWHLLGIKENWQEIPLGTRIEIYGFFKKAKLEFFFWLILLESGGQKKALSHKGARGLFQVMPSSAKNLCNLDPDHLWDPISNALCSVQILEHCRRFGGWQAQAVCYNGQLKSCPLKGYQRCIRERYLAGEKKLLGTLTYPIKVWLYCQIGKEFFLDDLNVEPIENFLVSEL